MIFKRGQKFKWNNKIVIILGAEDFEGYEYNRPNEKWELIEDSNGKRGWVGNIHLKKVKLK